jgi:hypothetical protein
MGEEQTIRLVPRMIKRERFDELILGQIDYEWHRNKLSSFYTLKDKDDETLTERGVRREQIFGLVVRAERKGRVLTPASPVWLFYSVIWIRLVPLRHLLIRFAHILKRKK